ncbi:MAG: hypothetical protein IJY09_08770 [Lachnospiraceae bacterium]|nr:hypothetical protein [Lachnospiraceae bacterium]
MERAEHMIQNIIKSRIILTAFCGTSAEKLIKDIKDYRTILLPNDKVKDSDKLVNAIAKDKPDFVISFGQRPNIKNKVHIETTAKDGELQLETNFDCDKLKQLFNENGMNSKISHNAGTSFCNCLYWNGLQYIFQNNLDTKMIFVHIPFAKNITDFASFRKQIFDAIERMR